MSRFIATTHSGSLPRVEALDRANEERGRLSRDGILPGNAADVDYDRIVAQSVDQVVQQQLDDGIDIVNDGEYGKTVVSNIDAHAWFGYIEQRVSGWQVFDHPQSAEEQVPSTRSALRLSAHGQRRDRIRFHDVYTDPTSGVRITKQTAFPRITGPITYIGQQAVSRDITNLNTALAKHPGVQGFISSISPGSASRIDNVYYATQEELIWAWADALHEEYQAIVDAGLILQIDDPSLAENWDQINPEPSVEDYQEFTRIRIDALNYALRGIPADRVRLHVCWGSWHGPHTTDIPLRDLIDVLFEARVGAYLLEAGNPRHEHEWQVWEDVTLPDDKILVPGVISHCTNVVEHPELVAQRIERFAKLVGPDRVIAGTDCGLGGRVHPHIARAKLRALAQGAHIASERLSQPSRSTLARNQQ
ncbi:cobalamin-independent methionine synthase II family protein [Bifidobacterium apri]|uniref:Methionine synthase n=1 Tax=Bifidobacterium apri TaxID=1769423 RepID=A0A6A2VB16_9BIFI|nr:cobalamin-independent methionine synthase II family protein [Bifidobacterium apri]KAB8301959.1 methionine synthase [Bifidobacterium apri]